MAVLMQARFNSKCSSCSGFIGRGTYILYDRATKTAAHEKCPTAQTAPVQHVLPNGKTLTNTMVVPAPAMTQDAAILVRKAPEMGAAVMVFLLTPAIRAFLDANDPKSVEQARNALRETVFWRPLLQGEAFAAEQNAVRNETRQADLDATKTIFDDVAPFVELTDPRVVAPAPVSELDGYKAALVNARTAGDAHAVAALEASIAAATAPKIEERKCIRCGLPASSHEQHVLEDHENRTLAERAAPSQYSRPVDPDDGDALNPAPVEVVQPVFTNCANCGTVDHGSVSGTCPCACHAPKTPRAPPAPAMGSRFSAQRGRRIARAAAPRPAPAKVEREDLPF